MAARRPTGGEGLRIIDCDVHPMVKGGLRTLFPYLPDAWRRRFELKAAELTSTGLTFRFAHPSGSAIRSDAAPPGGGPAGSDPDYMKRDLLEQHGIECAILNSLQAGALAAALAGPDESIVLCSAFNDFFLEEWGLAGGGPLRLAMPVPSQDPQAAAAEIRRVGGNRAVAAVALPLISVLMGNRYYYPIYAEAEAQGLPILVHVTGTDGIYQGPPMLSGGVAENYAERFVGLSQIGEANLTSLMFSGAFERFPGLKFVFVEYGFAWALPLLWRMDKTWRSLRWDTPWVKKSPFDYLHERVRFTTQPLDEPEDAGQLNQLIGMLGDDVLLFSTDYPHWDNDMPGQSLRTLPADSRRRIFGENALETFRL